MYIRCPKCGRRGHLPDRLVPEAHNLRCRKCKASFKPPELTRLAAERGAGGAFGSIASIGRPEPSGAFMTDGFFSAFDESVAVSRQPGPGDSNYELTFTLQDAEGDSGGDWDAETGAFEPEAPSSDEVPVLSPTAGASALESWPQRFLDSWGLYLIGTALALIALTVPLIAYLLWRILGSSGSVDLPSPTLIAGFACSVALLMISVPLILLAASLTELVRDLRRLHEDGERRGALSQR